jgi:hypothetical protein
MVRKIMFSIAAGLVIGFAFLCNPTSTTNNSPLVGAWNMTQQINNHSYGMADTIPSGVLVANKYIFNSDFSLGGTAVLFGTSINYSGTWSVKADSIILKYSPSDIQTWYYSVSGSSLTLKRTAAEGTGTKATVEYYTKQ